MIYYYDTKTKFNYQYKKEFADWLNIKQNTLSRYENGIRPVPFILFMDLCRELGYEISIKKREDSRRSLPCK